MNKQEASILKDRAGAIYGAVDHAKSLGDIDHRLAKDILEFTRLVKEYTEKPLLINEEKDRYVKVDKVRELLEQLDEPQRVKVPAYVAEWFETNKYVLDRAILDYMFEDYASDNSEFGKWFDNKNGKPIVTLVRMLDGYEVEEEPLYTVTINLDRKYHLVVDEGDGNDEIGTTLTTSHGVLGYRYFLTEKEIKSADENLWLIAVPVERGGGIVTLTDSIMEFLNERKTNQ